MQTAFSEPLARRGPGPREDITSLAISASSAAARHKLERLVHSIGARAVAESARHDGLLMALDPRSTMLDSRAELSAVAARALTVCIFFENDAASVVPVSRLLQAGIAALLPMEITTREFGAALEAVRSGLQVVHPSFFQKKPRFSVPTYSHEELTDREQQVLAMMADGLGNKEIAMRLGISSHTVKFHISSILGKLGAGSRTEAVSIGMRTGKVLI